MNVPASVRILLWPFSIAYGALARLRAALYAKGIFRQARLGAPVISVGNLTVGGTGKTPMVIRLAEYLLAEGKRVAILSRGYKGNGTTSDEIELMKARLAGRVVFGVGKNRLAAGQTLQGQGVDVFILDDGFQHLQLARDLNILLMDASLPLGREPLLPAGTLREPISAMNRADILVFTRTGTVPGSSDAIDRLQNYPVFSAATELLGYRLLGGGPALLASDAIGTGPFYSFCGIGNPAAFFRDLENWHVPVVGKMAFRDHHSYSAEDVLRIEQAAEKAGGKALLTTEKDAQNLARVSFSKLQVYIAVIDLHITPEDAFRAVISGALATKAGAAA